eukprot:1775693-Pyramimonas_sp.AAC.1
MCNVSECVRESQVLPEEGLRVVWTGKMPRKGQWPEVLPYPSLVDKGPSAGAAAATAARL